MISLGLNYLAEELNDFELTPGSEDPDVNPPSPPTDLHRRPVPQCRPSTSPRFCPGRTELGTHDAAPHTPAPLPSARRNCSALAPRPAGFGFPPGSLRGRRQNSPGRLLWRHRVDSEPSPRP